MPFAAPLEERVLDPAKFRDPWRTAKGERRAHVALDALRTLWFNTGTLCNLTCAACYIESSPRNDRLAYLTLAEVEGFLDEVADHGLPTEEIGFTGGEPFMNPDLLAMLELCLARGFRVLVLTNAMRPMMKCAERLLPLAGRYGERLVLRVSLDHYTEALHQIERGPRSWAPALEGLQWLVRHGFAVDVAGRLKWGEPEDSMRAGYARLFQRLGLDIDAHDPHRLVLFPEMDETEDVPEITEACWGILGVDPGAMMCAASRMVVKRKGAVRPVVVPCTLLPYDEQFELGTSLAEAAGSVHLNHPHCARFCVLGGGSCSA
jgi:uncharacterized Fe-S cluster-containing radical SAM superfamily protein